jgi:phosphoribosylformylglycinamidine synthase subunit PurS
VFKARVYVTLRPSILDPQGKAISHAVDNLGVRGVREVRMGKLFEVTLESATEAEARETTGEICRKLLANPVMENFEFTISTTE